MGRIRCLVACSTPSAIDPGQSKSPLLLSTKFSAHSELTIFSDSSALPLHTKLTRPLLLFFSKAFEPILRHVLHDKMTPLYLVIFS